MAAYRRHVGWMVRFFRAEASRLDSDPWFREFAASCVPDYEHLLRLDRRQLRRVRREGGGYL